MCNIVESCIELSHVNQFMKIDVGEFLNKQGKSYENKET